MKRMLLGLFLLLFAFLSFSQKLNVGGVVGLGLVEKDTRIINSGLMLEYTFNEALFSLNTEFLILFIEKKPIMTFPFYLKVLIGNKFKFSPIIGGFIRTNSNYGWIFGLSVEYELEPRLSIFLKGDYYIDYRKEYYPTHFGDSYPYIEKYKSIWINIGVKYKLDFLNFNLINKKHG